MHTHWGGFVVLGGSLDTSTGGTGVARVQAVSGSCRVRRLLGNLIGDACTKSGVSRRHMLEDTVRGAVLYALSGCGERDETYCRWLPLPLGGRACWR